MLRLLFGDGLEMGSRTDYIVYKNNLTMSLPVLFNFLYNSCLPQLTGMIGATPYRLGKRLDRACLARTVRVGVRSLSSLFCSRGREGCLALATIPI